MAKIDDLYTDVLNLKELVKHLDQKLGEVMANNKELNQTIADLFEPKCENCESENCNCVVE